MNKTSTSQFVDSLRKQLPRTRSQDVRQWIVDLVGLT